MLTEIEKILLEREESREQKSKERWFGNTPSPLQGGIYKSRKRAEQEEDTPLTKEERKSEYFGAKTTYFFLLLHFDELDKLIPEDPEMETTTRASQINELINHYRENVTCLSVMDDDEIWSIVNRNFSKRYLELKRDKGIC